MTHPPALPKTLDDFTSFRVWFVLQSDGTPDVHLAVVHGQDDLLSWSHAVHLLLKQSVQIRTVAALDLEESTIKSYCVSFGPACFSPGTPVGSFLHLHVVPPFAWHAGISDRYRQHAFSPLQCDLWSVNCLCISWSQSGRKQGLHSEGGRVLICTTANAATSRPLAICCEQGAEFQSHPDCEVVADLWQQAGFRINREGVFDLQEVGPVRRRLSLGLSAQSPAVCTRDQCDEQCGLALAPSRLLLKVP